MPDTNGRYFPSLRGVNETECRTCAFSREYRNIRLRADELADMEDGESKDRLLASFESDVWALLAEANEIAELRCQGNYKAAMAVFS